MMLRECLLTFVSGIPLVTGEISPTTVDRTTKTGIKSGFHIIDKFLATLSLSHQPIDGVNSGIWYKVKLGESKYIHKIVLYQMFYTDSYYATQNYWSECHESVSKYRACKDEYTDVQIKVNEEGGWVKTCGTLQHNYGLKLTDQIYTFSCRAIGDEVLLYRPSGEIASLDIVIFNSGNYKLMVLK